MLHAHFHGSRFRCTIHAEQETWDLIVNVGAKSNLFFIIPLIKRNKAFSVLDFVN